MATGSINISSNISRNTLLTSLSTKACSNFTATPNNESIILQWKDPDDFITSDNYSIVWKSSRVVRKVGGYPINENDGTVVVESSIRNQYVSTGFIDKGLVNGTKYFYRVFPCSNTGAYNHEIVEASATPIAWKIMTVNINLANSNPATCGSYADDASLMPNGVDANKEWQEFFGYRVCLFKDGRIVGYLDPNNYDSFLDGSIADITSGNSGDVMIEFPRRGVKISKSGKVLTVSMTNNPNDSNFKYYAHQRGETDKNFFYIGAYDGYVAGNKLRSLSEKQPTDNTTFDNFLKYGKANGSGYNVVGFYQMLFIQVMYVLQFKGNLNSQKCVGQGNTNWYPDGIKATGRSNRHGLIYGDTTVVKLFGLEDIWGNTQFICNNAYMFSTCHVGTTTDDTTTDKSKYKDRGSYGMSIYQNADFFIECLGTTETGFIMKGGCNKGSETTYFCDWGSASPDSYLILSGNNSTAGGLFYCGFSSSNTSAYNGQGSRLQYL